MAPEETRSFSG